MLLYARWGNVSFQDLPSDDSQGIFLAEISFQFVIPFFNESLSLLAGPATQLFQCLENPRWFEVASLLRRGMAEGTKPSHRALWVTAGMSLAPKLLV